MSNPRQSEPRHVFRYLFGPVPSRRLGLSLGIDLLTPKTCTYDCIFCEVGRTTRRTISRRSYAPVSGIRRELERWLGSGGNADVITLAGSGEPTLHTRFGDILDVVKKLCRIRTVLLTNGSLLYLPRVRAAAKKADVVKVSLSAWDDDSFKAINRPDPKLKFEQLLDGLRAFRKEYSGELWVEVFIVSGVNDNAAGLKKIAGWIAGMRPDKIHLNTVVRPPAHASARAVSAGRMEKLARLFTPRAEVIARFKRAPHSVAKKDDSEWVGMLRRRPCTVSDVAKAFGVGREEARKRLSILERSKAVRREKRGTAMYYRA